MFISFMLHGYGGEVVLGKISKKAAEFWQSDEMEEHFHSYVFGPEWWEDENPDIKIPKYAQLGSWHDIDDLGHEWGAAQSGSYLTVNEMSDDTWDADQAAVDAHIAARLTKFTTAQTEINTEIARVTAQKVEVEEKEAGTHAQSNHQPL